MSERSGKNVLNERISYPLPVSMLPTSSSRSPFGSVMNRSLFIWQTFGFT